MDEESPSTSQDSFNSRGFTNPVFEMVYLPEVHCALCETIYSPGSEANRPFNVCQDCKVRLEPYNEESWPVLWESRQPDEEALQGFAESQQVLEETQRILEEETQRILEEELRQRLERRRLRDARRRFRDVRRRQRVERRWQREENRRILEEELQQRFEPRWQHVERCLEGLPRLVITEEHEKKHNGLNCAICLDPLLVGRIVNQLPCLHFFHPLCIVPWLKVRMSCPTCRYKLSSAFHNETRQNSNRRIGFQEIVHEGSNVNSSSATYDVSEPEVVAFHNETRQNSNRRIGFEEIVHEESNVNGSSVTYDVNEPEVVAFLSETRQNSNRRIGFQEIVHEGSNLNSSSATYDVNEPEVVVSESYNETTDNSVRDREGRRGGWFLFASAPIVSLVTLVGIALVECVQNIPGDGRGRGSTGHVKFSLQCQQQVRTFSSGSSSTRTSNSSENN